MIGPPPSPATLILIHYAELGLKGQNQPQFRRQLRENIRLKLKRLDVGWRVEEARGYFTISVPGEAPDLCLRAVLEKLQEIFGIAWLAPVRGLARDRAAEQIGANLAALESPLLDVANQQFAPNRTFAVRVNRADKSFPLASPELESRLGGLIRKNSPWDKVNLIRPDVTFHLDIRENVIHLFSEKLKGPGGLPVGTSGRVLALLSGGIDSPVAAWLMAKRGCRIDFIHFTATSMQPEEARQYKVWRLAQRLSDFTLSSRLFLLPYTYFDIALLRQKVEYDLILFRRFMSRVAEHLARRLKAQALVTGDNLGQVASQTLSNLVSTSRATEMPILRPLLGYDKEEIMALAHRIDTYKISLEPYKDCCALIAEHPRTRSRHTRLAELERRVFPDYEQLIEQTLAEAVCLKAGAFLQSSDDMKSEVSTVQT